VNKTQNSNIQYLRAFSVILVILFHVYPDNFYNGFLGVDIFFVISGYLITKILFEYENLLLNKVLFRFYLKRFLRIYPALFFAVLLTYFLAKLFGPPVQSLSGEIISSILSYSNFFYIFTEVPYFETIFKNPLNHVWSLSAEVQFYLFYPFLLFIIFKITGKDILKIRNYFIILILSLFIISIYIEIFNHIFSFYSSLTRIWIFIFGGFIYFSNFNHKNFYKIIGSLLILSVLFIRLDYSYQFKSLIVSLGIYFFLIGVGERDILEKSKKTRNLLLIIGNSSYSIYLLHLPLLYYLDFYFEGYKKILIFIIVLIILTYFLYNFIEKKFRKILFIKKQAVISFVILSAIIIINYPNNNQIISFFKTYNFFEKNYDFSKEINPDNIKLSNLPVTKKCKNIELIKRLDTHDDCILSKKNDPQNNFFLHGNSFVLHFIPLFKYNEKVEKINFVFSNEIFNKHNSNFINNESKHYKKFNYVLQINSLTDFSKFKNFVEKNEYFENLNIILIGQIPYLNGKINPLTCLNLKKSCTFSKEEDIKNKKDTDLDIEQLRDELIEISKTKNNIYFFDTYNKICPEKNCYTYKDNKLIYYDKSHLTPQGAMRLIEKFDIFLTINNLY